MALKPGQLGAIQMADIAIACWRDPTTNEAREKIVKGRDLFSRVASVSIAMSLQVFAFVCDDEQAALDVMALIASAAQSL